MVATISVIKMRLMMGIIRVVPIVESFFKLRIAHNFMRLHFLKYPKAGGRFEVVVDKIRKS